MNSLKKSVLCFTAAGAMMAGGLAGPAVAAPNPPTPVSASLTVNCAQGPLKVAYAGKGKTVQNASGVKWLSPGLKATVTNTAGESRTYSVTGTLRPEPAGTNNTRFKATGRNLLTRSTADNPTELYLVSGNVTFVVDARGDEIDKFTGPGNVVDLCAELN